MNVFANDDWVVKIGKTLLYVNIAVLIIELIVADHFFDLSFNKIDEKNRDGSYEMDLIVYGSVFLNFVVTLIWSIVRHMFYYSNPEYDTTLVNMREFYIPWITLADHIFAVGHYAVFHSLKGSKRSLKPKHKK